MAVKLSKYFKQFPLKVSGTTSNKTPENLGDTQYLRSSSFETFLCWRLVMVSILEQRVGHNLENGKLDSLAGL